MNIKISTSITINSTPEKIWNVLTDFNSYPKWNPFINSIIGKPIKGSKIEVNIGTMQFTPLILECTPNLELKWIGKLFFSGLFDGKHRFYLTGNNNGTTTLIHSESFSGILIPIFKKKILTNTKEGFEKMNIALKRVVEKHNE